MSKRSLNKSIRSKRLRKRPKARGQTTLGPADWVATASDMLVDNNINGVDIPNLCRRLGVTKGSFYWHFDRRRDLLTAILDDWRTRMTLDVTARASRLQVSAPSVLRYLLGLIRKPRPNRNGAIERSVRDWGRIDSVARAAVMEVDRHRISYFEALFRQCDFPEKEARIRAYAAYAIMMGDSILKETTDSAYLAEDYINALAELLLSDNGRRTTESAHATRANYETEQDETDQKVIRLSVANRDD